MTCKGNAFYGILVKYAVRSTMYDIYDIRRQAPNLTPISLQSLSQA